MTDSNPRTEPRRAGPGLTARSAGNGDGGSDWTANLADTIESLVGAARDKTVVPISKIVRIVTRVLLAALLLGAAVIVVAIGFFRLTEVYLPGDAWVAHIFSGGAFVFAGLFCFARR
ncbi:MAG: hypothetical protein ACRDV9_15185 [Acidimicrobiia bacterium]